MQAMSILISLASGGVSHLLFNKYESRRISSVFAFLLGPPTIALWFYPSNRSSVTAILSTYTIHLASLIASVVAYRLSPYHPLAAIPGPVIGKVTRLWAYYLVYTGEQHRFYMSLHARYGTHVRTGPNHVHICDASALPSIMGAKPFIRGERYDADKIPGATGSVLTLRDPQAHAQRRKIWDKSLNPRAILSYQDMLSSRISQLVDALAERQGAEVDLAEWVSYLSFDFMGDLAFGSAFQLLRQGSDVDGYMRTARLGVKIRELNGTIPWIRPFLFIVPPGSRRFTEFAKECVLSRKFKGSSRKDIFYYLLDEEGVVGTGPPSLPNLILESGLAIVAGSDTTGTALSNIFFYLLSNPKVLHRLQEEVDGKFPPGTDSFSPSVAAEMKLLNGVINETLRLQPAVPTGIQRFLPLGQTGVEVAGRWIPEGTTIQVSAYSVHRDPRYFYPDPEKFHPDRWLESTPGSKLDQSAYFPFSFGPTSCAGKSLALLELQMTICSLIQKFEFELSPSFRIGDWEKRLQDHFILVKGELPVRVKARKQSFRGVVEE